MIHMKFESIISRVFPILLAATACLLLGSCASTADMPPPPGSAIIDATPDAKHMDRVEEIELVSINGRSVKGTRSVIQPGPNTIKTRFRWPQGQVQEADLRFYATPGTVYFINYNVYPPAKKLTNSVAQKIVDSSYIFGGPPAAVVGVCEQVGHGIAEYRKSATYIDLAVTAHHSSQGVVRQVRAYPDGRVDGKPWAAWAQMKAP